jgi:hypothetical protein
MNAVKPLLACVVICGITSIFGSPLGDNSAQCVFPTDPLRAVPSSTFSGRVSACESSRERSPIATSTSSRRERSSFDLPVVAQREQANDGRPLLIGLIVAFILLGSNLIGRVYCREYEDLREHLMIASRNLFDARQQRFANAWAWLSSFHLSDNDVLCHLSQVGGRLEQLGMLRDGIADHQRARHARRAYCRECRDLKEHVVLASRQGSPSEIEVLGAALVDHIRCHHSSRSGCRECGDLAEHYEIASRNLADAKNAMVAVIASKMMSDPEIEGREQQVVILRRALEDHCRVHGCRGGQLVFPSPVPTTPVAC